MALPISRRSAACVAAGALLRPLAGRSAARAPRLAALDWSLDELALLLGHAPVAASEADGYRAWVKEPVLPDSVADLGLRQEPNLELLQQLRPDLILTIPQRSNLQPALSRIAPTLSLPIFSNGFTPYKDACAALLALGERIGASERARSCLSQADATLERLRQRLDAAAARPVTVIRFVDAHSVFVFTSGGLFADMLERLGLANGYVAPPSLWGYAQVPLLALARLPPDTRLFYLDDPLPPDAAVMMREDPLWRGFPFVRRDAVRPLRTVWFFGAVGSALRFAALLTEAVLALDASDAG